MSNPNKSYKAKHTLGPWTAKKTAMPDTYWILGPTGGMVAKTEINPADAPLVSAAPELLNAAYRALDVIQKFVGDTETCDQLRKAISKAEGWES